MARYWVNTVNRDHVLTGKELGVIQADHDKRRSLDRMTPGDLVVFYSPHRSFEDKTPLQAFTAIAEIANGEIYQVEMSETFHPHRRDARYLDAEEAPIRPLIPTLNFIENKQYWGYPFRVGVFEIDQADFERIASAMAADLQ